MQARFPTVEVRVFGRSTEYTRTSDLGEKRTFHFCPECGATVFYTTEDTADVVAIPVGAFADPGFPAPTVSVYESRRHPWLSLSPEIQRNAPELWEPLHPLFPGPLFGKDIEERWFDYHVDVPPLQAANILGGRLLLDSRINNEGVAVIAIEKVENAAIPRSLFVPK